jgi:hypothetical protein
MKQLIFTEKELQFIKIIMENIDGRTLQKHEQKLQESILDKINKNLEKGIIK